MLEINLRPETAAEFKAALQLVTALANAEAEAEPVKPKTKPWKAPAVSAGPGAPTAAPAAPPAPVEEPTDIVNEDIPFPPFDDAKPGYSPQQVLEALQEYARTNGAVALKEVLDRFSARRVSDIKPAHFAEVMAIARGEIA